MCAADKLLKRIEYLRNKMTDVAMEKGFTSPESIAISQELDRLLNLYQSMKQTNNRKKVK
ncbi:aspartyl-phosphate phosphatase Spo0E family protein [Lentibacillus salicampi]|uniref:Aspartyl-phosphate phosphatase Spo0E family protein n=1 Tax=Lentibacillus salicampi TaxID=175306 RepID=A0A4Y9AF87_9BACI|nr:aspartyl-phosphate phosphatase Spo0E family protein [Lentibacillus salicampi]TFJ94486.1 aspartyl-phosphate phosphatase Spo0E family protein [Lentibacillus salicampi]